MEQAEVFTRRNLPHWFVAEAAHFVTYRLHGSLPAVVLDELRGRKDALLAERPRPGETPARRLDRVHKQLFVEYDRRLDAGADVRWLADPRVAALVRSNLYHHHGTRYHLLAYCIMSNHVHVLLLPLDEDYRGAGSPPTPGHAAGTPAPSRRAGGPHARPGRPTARLPREGDQAGESPDAASPLSAIMHSLKSYTAHQANKVLRRNGPFWQAESYDHWVRDEDEMERIVEYIAHNPVKAGLVERPCDWFYCSAHDRFLSDGEPSAWLRWES